MRRWTLAALTVLSSMSCGDDTAGTAGQDASSDSGSMTLATSSSSPTGDSMFSASATVESSSGNGSDATDEVSTATTQSDDSTSSAGSTTESVPDDAYALCDSAVSEQECESVEIASTPEMASPSCQWRHVYTISTAEQCGLVATTPRCILFFSNLQGCGWPGCELPNDGGNFVREVDGATEVLIYLHNDICGPLPEAPPAEANWAPCWRPGEPGCDCICELL